MGEKEKEHVFSDDCWWINDCALESHNTWVILSVAKNHLIVCKCLTSDFFY